MQCMKCGRDVTGSNVFCEECLGDMAEHPVKPGTVVILPSAMSSYQPKKQQVKRQTTAEDQIRRLKRRNTILSVLLAISLAVTATLAIWAIPHLDEDGKKYLPGQNYTAIGSKDPVNAPPETEPDLPTFGADTGNDR